MIRTVSSIVLASLLCVPLLVVGQSKKPGVVPNYGKLPLSFEANQGQTDPQVRFTSRGNGYSLFLTDSAAVLDLSKPASGRASGQQPGTDGKGSAAERSAQKGDVIRMELVGADPKAHVEGTEPLPGKANYFVGNDPARWHTDVPTYAKVRYASVYPGVDLVYYGNQRQLEYDFVVAPGADPSKVRLHFEGAKRLALTPSGDLEVIGHNGQIAFHKPVIYQTIDGGRRDVAGKFMLSNKDQVQFALGGYDRERALVIDPVLTYSTYFGSLSSSYSVAVDTQGNAYIAGSAGPGQFPTVTGSYNTSQYSCCAFVTKFNPSGSALVYADFFGGASFPYIYGDPDTVSAIAVNSSGEVYATGFAYSTDFPVTNGAFQSVNNAGANRSSNAFVVKINSSGSALLYATYLGGSTSSAGNAIAIDGSGNAYIAGGTLDLDFPFTSGSFQTVNLAHAGGYVTGFVAKLGATGTSLGYATYLGGSNLTRPNGIAVDGTGNVYIAGNTVSTDFPVTSGAFQTTDYPPSNVGGGINRLSTTAFVTKLNPSGTNEVYSTYLGGNGGTWGISSDQANAIAVDGSGNAYVAGSTQSTDFPITAGAIQTSIPSTNILGCSFVSKLNSDGSALAYSTYLAGGYQDFANGIVVDSLGDAYVVGGTWSQDFPVTPGALQVNANALSSEDGFVSELNPNGTQLIYSTYLGGGNLDYANKAALDAGGNLYVTGEAASTDFPVTSSAYLRTWGGSGFTGFLTKLALSQSTSPQKTATPSFNPPGGQFAAAQSITLADTTPGAVFYYTTDGSVPTKSSTRYQSPIAITKTASITAFAAANGYANSDVATTTITIGTSTQTAPTVSVTPSSSTVNTAQSVQVTVNISGSGATPTGSIVLTSYGYTSPSVALSNGSATVSIPAGSLAVGIDTITATYTPDSSSSAAYKSSTGTATVTVSKIAPTVTVTPSSTNITTEQALSVSVTVSGVSGNSTPTGTIVLTSGSYTSASATLSGGSATISIPAGSLSEGSAALTAMYTPDSSSSSIYASGTGTANVTVTHTVSTATVTVTPSASSITTVQSLTVSVTVSGSSGGTTPTGTVVLTSGSYASTATALSGGTATIPVPAGSLLAGSNTLTATYTPDTGSSSIYNSASGTAAVTVSKVTPAVTVTPASNSITTGQALSVTVAVNAGSGSRTATGTVTLTSGSYSSSATALSNGSATISVAAGSLTEGTDTITAAYTPDASSSPIYAGSTGTASVTVTTAQQASFSISGTSVTLKAGATQGNTSTITITPFGGFTGSVALSAAVTSSPSGSAYSPTFSFGSTSPATISGSSAGTATLTITTTAPTSTSAMAIPHSRDKFPLAPVTGAALAGLLLFMRVPRSRSWLTRLGTVLLLAIAMGAFVGCGGGGGTKTSNTGGTPTGAYTITVIGTSGSTSSAGTITLTVQ